jgi:outer membrane protein assembly factor BamB
MLVWKDQVDRGGDFDTANGIAVAGPRVFVQGLGGACILGDSPPSDCDVFIRSYDGDTGTLLWEAKTGTVGIDDDTTPQVVVVESGLLFGAWSANHPTTGPKGDWLVQAYRASTGQLVWEDLVDTGGGITFAGAEVPLRVAAHGSALFVVGRTVDATNNWNFVIRAYHTRAEVDNEGGDVGVKNP